MKEQNEKTKVVRAHAIAAAFLVGGDAGAAERAERLAKYVMQEEEERHA